MQTALVIVDLEGVCGVDALSSVIYGDPNYPFACQRLHTEVLALSRGLRALGVTRIRIADSHRSGSGQSNLHGLVLPSDVEVLDATGGYGDELFENVDVVACLGMHGGAGSAGFGAHTVDVHCVWRGVELSTGRHVDLSESDLVLELCAERGLPVLCVTGDDVLAKSVHDAVPYLVTKTADGLQRARSRPTAEVDQKLEEIASNVPKVPPRRLGNEVHIEFKSRWQAERAAPLASRVDESRMHVSGDSFAKVVARGFEIAEVSAAPLVDALNPDSGVQDILQILARPPYEEAKIDDSKAEQSLRRTLSAFLELTSSASEPKIALRALILTMLERVAPRWFVHLELEEVHARSMVALDDLPTMLLVGDSPDVGQARVDAWYLRTQNGRPVPEIVGLSNYLEHLRENGDDMHAWLLAEMTGQPRQPGFRPESRLDSLYFATHVILLRTEYMRRTAPAPELDAYVESLLLATPWVLDNGHYDLAGELALCLAWMGERGSELERLVDAILVAQDHTGAVIDRSMVATSAELAEHATGVALLALACVWDAPSA